MSRRKKYYPVTPGGTVCTWLAADSEEQAINNLLRDASHVPYEGWDSPNGMGFKQRGYTIMHSEEI